MKRLIGNTLPFFAAGAILAGCGSGEQEKVDTLTLTVLKETYPVDLSEAGPKGSGDFGDVVGPIRAGETIVAACIDRPEEYPDYSEGDTVLIEGGPHDGENVSLVYYDVSAPTQPINTFNLSAEEIRAKLELCFEKSGSD